MGIEPVLVSVVVPIYNHARFLRACFESIGSETYSNIELLAIDDGSTDGSYDVAKEWMDQNSGRFARVELKKQKNAGITSSLNGLLRMSCGEYIVLLASDDILLPGGILARIQALQKNPQWLAVFGDCKVIDDAGATIHQSGLVDLYKGDKEALRHAQTIETELIWRWSVPGPVTMARRAAYFSQDGIGFYPEDLRVEDRYFYLAALSRHALGFVDFPVGGYRLHSNQSISTSALALSESVLKADERFVSRFSGPSSLALWIRSRTLYVNKASFAGRVQHALLYRARAFIGRMVLYLNSRTARKLTSTTVQH
jgi:glycosyltransferase involved in cell wall biosynthesis